MKFVAVVRWEETNSLNRWRDYSPQTAEWLRTPFGIVLGTKFLKLMDKTFDNGLPTGCLAARTYQSVSRLIFILIDWEAGGGAAEMREKIRHVGNATGPKRRKVDLPDLVTNNHPPKTGVHASKVGGIVARE
jgi:hypothetical protein